MLEEQITMEEITVEKTCEQLRRIGDEAMAARLSTLEMTGDLYNMSPLEVISNIVSEQLLKNTSRYSEHLKQRCHMYLTNARLADIDYDPTRKLNPLVISQLRTNSYISQERSVLIFAATGCGKTYLACALANNACEDGYKARYYQMSDLMYEYRTELLKGNDIKKFIKKVGNVDLLIIDDFMLTSLTTDEAEFLFKVMSYPRARNKTRSYVFCSQLMKEEIYTRLSECSPATADAIMDRIVHGAYEIRIEGESMRAKQAKAYIQESSGKEPGESVDVSVQS